MERSFNFNPGKMSTKEKRPCQTVNIKKESPWGFVKTDLRATEG